MLRPMWNLSLMTVLTATALVACGEDKGTSETGASTTAGTEPGTTTDPTVATMNPTAATMNPTVSSTDEPTAGTGSGTDESATMPTTSTDPTMGGETAADGEACTANSDCASQGCFKYRDLEAGECVAAPAGGNTRIAGTVVDFATQMTVPGAELRVIGALSALSDPANAPPVLMATANGFGEVDVVSATPISEGIGIVGIITGGAYYTSATGLASPTAGVYGPMNGNHDIWGVPTAKLTEWSGYLMADDDLATALPLGEKGGVVGFVRDGAGAGKAGAKVVSVDGASSTAKIRYLAEDGMSFTSDMTSSNGIFVLVGPGLAEKFKVEGGTVEGTAGSSEKAVFVMILTEP